MCVIDVFAPSSVVSMSLFLFTVLVGCVSVGGSTPLFPRLDSDSCNDGSVVVVETIPKGIGLTPLGKATAEGGRRTSFFLPLLFFFAHSHTVWLELIQSAKYSIDFIVS